MFNMGEVLVLRDGDPSVDGWDSNRLQRSVRPPDFDLVDARGGSKTKMQGKIVLRSIAISADYILALPNFSDRDINTGANRVARDLVRRITN